MRTYVIFLADGMADEQQESLGGKTPLMVAKTPNMDRMAQEGGMVGRLRTVPPSLPAGSDTANLSVMGFNPLTYYTGRAPIEAVNLNVPVRSNDIVIRMNLLTLSEEEDFSARTMVDYSGGPVSNDEGAALIKTLNEELKSEHGFFYAGTSYRNGYVWHNGHLNVTFEEPHNLTGRTITDHLPKGDPEAAAMLTDIMIQAAAILADHPVNIKRRKEGRKPCNSIWFWGAGSPISLPRFQDLYGLNGCVISGVDLVKGIGKASAMVVPHVIGATGGPDTDYSAKARAAIQAIDDGCNYIYLHVEAPDECGHHGDLQGKIAAIESIDRLVIKPVWDWLEKDRAATGRSYRLAVLPDHPTPVRIGQHTRDPVPFVVWSSDGPLVASPHNTFSEASAENGPLIDEGYTLLERMMNDAF